MKIAIGDPKLIYCAPVSEHTNKWGVYCIPRLWRVPDGRLIIRFNGEIDSPSNNNDCLPSIVFESRDDGNSWNQIYNLDGIDLEVLGNIELPYIKLSNGNTICFKGKAGDSYIDGILPTKVFSDGYINSTNRYYTFKQGWIPTDIFNIEKITYDKLGIEISREKVNFNFDDRELLFFGEVNGEKQKCYIKQNICTTPYITSIKILKSGELIGLCYGQNPTQTHYCGDLYLVSSSDNGITWSKRSTITKNSSKYKFGLVGDGGECSMDVSKDGTIYCVTRTDMSFDHSVIGGTTATMLFVSKDNGYTWENERPISDSSVTPHVLCFGENKVVVVYGRPGVHLIYSDDGGISFSEPISIIGKTLDQELKMGKSYLDAKYFNTSSYSNSFVERVSDNEFIVLYNDLHYDLGDKLSHKAGLIKRITIQD